MSWKYTGKETSPDKKNRVSLGTDIKTRDNVRYRVAMNEFGQILLDPVQSVPVYEAWLFENPERLASVMRGISQAEAGELLSIDLGEDQ